MPGLEELKNTIIKKYSDKFVFFELDGMPPSDIKGSMMWSGEDHKEFLSMAERLGSKIIYYSEAFPDDSLEKYEKHSEDIAEIELGFLYERILHTMSIYADWYTPNEDITDIEETAQQLEKKSAEEWAKELDVYIIKEFPTAKIADIDRIAEAFWQSKGVDSIRLDIKDRMKMDRVKEIIRKQQDDILREKEKKELPKIVEDCINWARENGLKKLNKSNLAAFLSEKELDLTALGEDALYNKVNLELTKKK